MFAPGRHAGVTYGAGRSGWASAACSCVTVPIGRSTPATGGYFPAVADRIAHDLGYVAMTYNSPWNRHEQGDFSLRGWVDDLARRSTRRSPRPFSPRCARRRGDRRLDRDLRRRRYPRVRAAALLSPRADFDDWAENPNGSSSTPRASGRSRRTGSRLRSRNGAGRSGGSARSTARRFAPAAARDAWRRRRERADDRRQATRGGPRRSRAEPARRGRPPPASRTTSGGLAARLARPGPLDNEGVLKLSKRFLNRGQIRRRSRLAGQATGRRRTCRKACTGADARTLGSEEGRAGSRRPTTGASSGRSPAGERGVWVRAGNIAAAATATV